MLFLELSLHFKALKRGEGLQAHFQNCRGLQRAQLKNLHQTHMSNIFIFRLPNSRDNFINGIKRDHESFQNMRALLCFPEIELCTAGNNVLAMRHIFRENIAQREQARLDAVHQSDHVQIKILLEIGVTIQPIQNLLRSNIIL